MTRPAILSALETYRSTWVQGQLPYAQFNAAEEARHCSVIEEFVQREELACERHCVEGHITSSALVTDRAMSRVLLTLHRKLGKWLQLGGHTDGSWDVADSALREAAEESGLPATAVSLFILQEIFAPGATLASPLPFDCDVHVIPARGQEPSHKHFDIRYLVLVDSDAPLAISEESTDLRWFTLSEARALTSERSMIRQFDKLEALRRFLEMQSQLGASPSA